MTDATILDLEAFLARERYALVLADYVDGLATADDLAAAGARMDAMELAKERAAFVSEPSYFAANSR
jgi:hypothetical protein